MSTDDSEITDRIIHLTWDGPHSLESVASFSGPGDYGVYQIYGHHLVYGAEVLLYIGKAERQTFATRLSQEGWSDNVDYRNVQIYLGRVTTLETSPLSPEQWARDISDAEQLLIHAHCPAMNSVNIQTIDQPRLRDRHVINWGAHRDLLPEVSGQRWTRLRHFTGNWVYPSK